MDLGIRSIEIENIWHGAFHDITLRTRISCNNWLQLVACK